MTKKLPLSIGFLSVLTFAATPAQNDILSLSLLNPNAASSYSFSIEKEFKDEILLEAAAKEDDTAVVTAKTKLIRECQQLRDKSLERLKNLNIKYSLQGDCLTIGMNTQGQSIASQSTSEGDWAWLTGKSAMGTWRYKITTKLQILF